MVPAWTHSGHPRWRRGNTSTSVCGSYATTFYASTFPDSRVTALHPGEILMDDFMEPLGISINALARRTVGADVDRSVKARVA